MCVLTVTHSPKSPSGDAPLPEAPLAPDARDHVVGVLKRQFADDVISEADFEARLQRVYWATTALELDAIVSDLPAPARGGGVPTVAPGGTGVVRIAALLSGQERRVVDVVPGQLQIRARLGYVELDLTRATFEPGVTTIDGRAFMGYVQRRFPKDVRVECDGHALLGFFSLKGAGAADAGALNECSSRHRPGGLRLRRMRHRETTTGRTTPNCGLTSPHTGLVSQVSGRRRRVFLRAHLQHRKLPDHLLRMAVWRATRRRPVSPVARAQPRLRRPRRLRSSRWSRTRVTIAPSPLTAD